MRLGVIVILLFAMVAACHQPVLRKPKESVWEQVLTQKDTHVESPLIYHGAEPIEWRFFHIDAQISWNYSTQTVSGKGYFLFTPHAYEQKQLVIQAQGMAFQSIQAIKYKGLNPRNATFQELDSIFKQQNKSNSKYRYHDSTELIISFSESFQPKDTLLLYIDWKAQPGIKKNPHASAISDTKGWYFINPNFENPYGIRETWTQGETESNSAWIPLIDHPNQKITHRLTLIHDANETCVSNGIITSRAYLPDGRIGETWWMSKPHAPYLIFVASGPFIKSTKYWRDSIPLYTFIEPLYAPYAHQIFKHTPDILTCFSQKLGFSYPWKNLSEIVGRDYVSGAMENTTAILYGSQVQKTARELIDQPNEMIQAHEIFHHWFGDWVTCESWSQIGLNESFATYGEYIWLECSKGKWAADQYLHRRIKSSFIRAMGSNGEQSIARYHYTIPDALFDENSYQKGGLVLHMLRNKLGDDIFFTSLKTYLERFGGKNAEWHQLRLVMEEVSGLDLDLFFKQWIFESAIPNIIYNGWYDENVKIYHFEAQQTQNIPLNIELHVDIYSENGSAIRHKINFDSSYQHWEFPCSSRPALVNPDPDKTLLCTKEFKNTDSCNYLLFKWGQNYFDKVEAVNAMMNPDELLVQSPAYFTLYYDIAHLALNDPSPSIQELGLDMIHHLDANKDRQVFYNELLHIAETSSITQIRADALHLLVGIDPQMCKGTIRKGLKDSSLLVWQEALKGLKKLNHEEALTEAKKMMANPLPEEIRIIGTIFPTEMAEDYAPVFDSILKTGDANLFLKCLPSLTIWIANTSKLDQFEKYLVIYENAIKWIVPAKPNFEYIISNHITFINNHIMQRQQKADSGQEKLILAKMAGLLQSKWPKYITNE